MATIKSEYYRFNGVSWDLHYFKTTIDQVVGLQTALDGKIPSRSGIFQGQGFDTAALFANVITNASTGVGFEYNILLNAVKKGYTITESGSALSGNPGAFFDGMLAPQYSSASIGLDETNPYVLLIEGLPGTHTQTGGIFGWTSRYWYPTKFKVEGYNVYGTAGWVTLKDQTASELATKDLVIPLFPSLSGMYTKFRITIYKSVGSAASDGKPRWGLSEIFFIHPEAQATHQYLTVEWANKLSTPRQINGVNFDGSANITIYDNTKLPLAGGTVSGPVIFNDAITLPSVINWKPAYNFKLGQTANGQEWSFDITRNGFTGGYWQVWDSSNLTLLKVDADTGRVTAVYSLYEGNERVYSPNNKPSWGDIQSKPIALTDTNQKIELGGTTQYIRLAYGGKSQAFIKHSEGVEYEVYTRGSDVISAITSLAAPTIFANTISSDGGSVTFSGGLDYINFSDVTIINVPDPTASHHPATKDYVDKFAAPVATKTASATLALTDMNKFIYVNSGSALTFTIPPNSSVAFPVGTEIHFLRYGTGEVSLAPGAGVTLQSEGSKRRINAQYQVVTIKKILTDTWALFGALKS